MINLREKLKIKKNRSRRDFLSFFGIMALVFVTPITLLTSNKIKNEKEYIFINGWLLKKKDLNDL